MNKLVIQDDEGKTTVVPLIREEITIGRKEGNTIRLTERNVSRRHARILRNNGTVNIEDLDSYNGVRVNGARIEGRCPLTATDRVQIGDYLIELRADGEAATAGRGSGKLQQTKPLPAVSDPTSQTLTEATAPTTNDNGALPNPAATSIPTGTAPKQTETTARARVVMVSAKSAGTEFELTNPTTVIGRTSENDIVIDHKSISRNHAKIVQEGDGYAIIDLHSSNGVRVNGEDYGKVDLRRGDLIDLGHVRMRFVAADEDFVFSRDAQVYDLPPTGNGKGLIVGILAFLAVVAAIGAFVYQNNQQGHVELSPTNPPRIDHPAPATVDAASTQQTQNQQQVAISVEDAGIVEKEKVDAAPAPEDPDWLAQARTAIKGQRWKQAADLANRTLQKQPSNAEAKKIHRQAKQEVANEIFYRRLQRSAANRDYSVVASSFKKIASPSVYYTRARQTHDRLQREYTTATTERARRLANLGKCADLKRLGIQARKLWVEAGEAAARYEAQCKPPPKVDPPKVDPPKVDPPPQEPSVGELISESKSAAKKSQFGKALRLCEQALRKSRGNQEAAMVCTIAACNLKNTLRAKRHIRSLNGSHRKGMARQICLNNGVTIE